jgi:hypothetical protein
MLPRLLRAFRTVPFLDTESEDLDNVDERADENVEALLGFTGCDFWAMAK